MAYRQRVFSRGGGVPTLASLRESFKEHKAEVAISRDGEPLDMGSTEWTEFQLAYSAQRRPIKVERLYGKADVEKEVASFLSLVEKLPDSPEKRDVISHLGASSHVYIFTVPTEDFTEAGWSVMAATQQFFAENTDGILQVDGEGFFYLDEDTFDTLLEMEDE